MQKDSMLQLEGFGTIINQLKTKKVFVGSDTLLPVSNCCYYGGGGGSCPKIKSWSCPTCDCSLTSSGFAAKFKQVVLSGELF